MCGSNGLGPRPAGNGQPVDQSERSGEETANETGGKLHLVNDPDEWKEAVSDVTDDLRFQYVLGYYPTREKWDGSFRQIKVETERGRLVVRARNGYYALP